jgi:hypothetical protein
VLIGIYEATAISIISGSAEKRLEKIPISKNAEESIDGVQSFITIVVEVPGVRTTI